LSEERKNYFEYDNDLKIYNFNDELKSDQKNILSKLNTFKDPILALRK
jgi:hypothetical protein